MTATMVRVEDMAVVLTALLEHGEASSLRDAAAYASAEAQAWKLLALYEAPSTHPCGVCGAVGDQDHSGRCSQSW